MKHQKEEENHNKQGDAHGAAMVQFARASGSYLRVIFRMTAAMDAPMEQEWDLQLSDNICMLFQEEKNTVTLGTETRKSKQNTLHK